MSNDFVLLPYQQQWIADESKVKVWEKSRRIGASWVCAADGVLTASAENGQDVYFISYNVEIAREFMRDVVGWVNHFNLVAEELEEVMIEDPRKDILSFQIKFASGKQIVALSSRPTNLRGRSGTVLIDEASFVDSLSELLKAAMAFLMWGGRVCILSTHDGVANPFNELVEDIRKGKKPYSLHRTTLDDALEQGLYKRICLKTGQEWSEEAQTQWRQELIDTYGDGADEELFCIPRESGGVYFGRMLVEQNMSSDIPVFRLGFKNDFALLPEDSRNSQVADWLRLKLAPALENLHPHYRTSYGFDFGRSGDLSYLIVLQEQPDLVRRAAFALELRNVPFKQQEQILFWIIERLPRFIGGAHDARGNGQYLAEVSAQRWGQNRIEQVQLSLHWYRENFPKYKAAHEDRQIQLPKDADLLDAHRLVEVIQGVPKIPDKRTKGTDGKQRHGDGAIACCLAWFASLKNGDSLPAIASFETSNW